MELKDGATSATTLRALHDIGAINLDVLLGQSSEVNDALTKQGVYLEPGEICYLFTIQIGPGLFELTKVARELKELGFELNRVGR